MNNLKRIVEKKKHMYVQALGGHALLLLVKKDT